MLIPLNGGGLYLHIFTSFKVEVGDEFEFPSPGMELQNCDKPFFKALTGVWTQIGEARTWSTVRVHSAKFYTEEDDAPKKLQTLRQDNQGDKREG